MNAYLVVYIYIYAYSTKANYTKYTLRYRYTVINAGREEEKRGKLPGQMDENSRESRDSDALESVSTKRLSFTRITHIRTRQFVYRSTLDLIHVIHIG